MKSVPQKEPVVWLFIWLGLIGGAIFNVEPIYLSLASEKYALNDKQLGYLASSELMGMAICSLSSVYWISRFNIKKLMLIGLFFMSAGNLISFSIVTSSDLYIVRFLTGLLGSGLVYVIAVSNMGKGNGATNNFAFFIFIKMIFTTIVLTFFPILGEHVNFSHILSLFLILSVSGLFLTVLLNTATYTVDTYSEEEIFDKESVPTFFLAGFSIFLLLIGLGAIWAYAERIASNIGLSLSETGSVLGISMVFQAFGALLPTIKKVRSYISAMSYSLLGQILGILLLYTADNAQEYLFGISIWGASLNISIVYLLAYVSLFSFSAKLLAFVPALQLFAVSTGSGVSTFFVTDHDYTSIFIISIVSLVFFYVAFMHLLKGRNA